MPDTPTPGVKGQSVGSPAAQDSSSISSLDPAATTSGWPASIATAGSFCLFWENGVGGLPTETRVSLGVAPLATDTVATVVATTVRAANMMLKRG